MGKKIVEGTCALCLKESILKDSHLIPKYFYKDGHNKKVFVNSTDFSAFNTSNQVSTHLLCGECEQRFNKHSEDSTSRYLSPIPKPTHICTRRNHFKPVINSYGIITRVPPPKIINELKYLAISIFWRASLDVWSQNGIADDDCKLSPSTQERFRRYLLNPNLEMNDVALMICVDTKRYTHKALTFPQSMYHPGYQDMICMLHGIKLHLFVGDMHKVPLSELFLQHTHHVLITYIDFRKLPDFRRIRRNFLTKATPKGNLAKELL